MREKNTRPLEELVGTRISIYPSTLLNRKRLFTTQSWVNMEKLRRAMQGEPDVNVEPPAGWVTYMSGKLAVVVGDGNHRIGLACIAQEPIPFYVEGILIPEQNYYGFGIIVQKIQAELRGSMGDGMD